MFEIIIGCPISVRAGDNIQVFADCDSGNIASVSVTGLYSNFVQSGDLIFVATTAVANGGSTGTVNFSITCTDNDGNTDTANCSVEVIDESDILICQESEPLCLEFVPCATVCSEYEAVICVSDCGPDCEEGFFTGSAKECPPVIEPPLKTKPVPLTQQFLRGSKQIAAPVCNNYLDDCEGCDDPKICCDPSMPVFCWNNVCACPGWTTTGPGILDTSAVDACCGEGKPWIFNGTGSMTSVSTDTPQVSCAIIWGHNIASGTVETFPPIFKDDPDDPPIQNIGLCYDDACIGGFTRPIVMNLVGEETGTVSMDINVTSTVDGGPVRISNIFMGQKLFLEDDLLPDGFTNPHNGSDFYTKTKKNDCGYVISREVVRQEKTLTLELDCLSDEWLKTKWRSYMRYLSAGNPVYFQHSRNRCPDDIFMGDMTSANVGSTYDGPFQSLTFTAEGFCSQPQAKRLI